MIEKCDRSGQTAPNAPQAEPDSTGSAFLLSQTPEQAGAPASADLPASTGEPAAVDLSAQSLRAIALFQAALDKGNMTAAASALKHLSDLHGLGKGEPATPAADELVGLSDAELEALIQSLLP